VPGSLEALRIYPAALDIASAKVAAMVAASRDLRGGA
jgi:hypothetical protein